VGTTPARHAKGLARRSSCTLRRAFRHAGRSQWAHFGGAVIKTPRIVAHHHRFGPMSLAPLRLGSQRSPTLEPLATCAGLLAPAARKKGHRELRGIYDVPFSGPFSGPTTPWAMCSTTLRRPTPTAPTTFRAADPRPAGSGGRSLLKEIARSWRQSLFTCSRRRARENAGSHVTEVR
jgi:hypothetical protein